VTSVLYGRVQPAGHQNAVVVSRTLTARYVLDYHG